MLIYIAHYHTLPLRAHSTKHKTTISRMVYSEPSASFRQSLLDFRYCWIVFNHIILKPPSGLHQLSRREAISNNSAWHTESHQWKCLWWHFIYLILLVLHELSGSCRCTFSLSLGSFEICLDLGETRDQCHQATYNPTAHIRQII